MSLAPRRLAVVATLAALVLTTGIADASAGSADGAASASVDALVNELRLHAALAPADFDAGYATDSTFVELRTNKLVIPALECTGAVNDLVILGQVSPTRQLIAGMFASCATGLTAIGAFVGSGMSVPASPGHVINIVTTTSSGITTATVTNETTGQVVTASGTLTDTSVLFGAATEPGRQVANFGSARLVRSLIDGVRIRADDLQKYNMVTGGLLRVKTGDLRRGTFKVVHKAF